jgi:hypothetical protein
MSEHHLSSATHHLSRTTRTLDMAQIEQIDQQLAAPGAPAVTAADLGLDEAGTPAAAILTKVWLRGSPEFPDIFADFEDGVGPRRQVQLHTPSLVALSRLLGLHHRWGV